MLASSSATAKFGFRIRTRYGLVVENLMIHGRDEADAERKLRQIYQHCEILECSRMLSAGRHSTSRQASGRNEATAFKGTVPPISK